MKPTICSRCKKNIAVIFITKVENGVSTNEGLCLKCARELKIKQVDDIVERMGITDEDLDNLNGEMMAMMQPEPDETDEDDIGSRTATFPHMNRLFGNQGEVAPREEPKETQNGKTEKPKVKKHKFLDTYCLSLTGRARAGELDKVVGREVETERVVQILNRRQKNNPCLIGEPGVGKTLKTCLTSRYLRDRYILTDKLTENFFKTEADIRPLFESQLEDCGVDYFDFYLMHSQCSENYGHFKACRAYETAFALKEEGKVRHVGISFHGRPELLEQILTEYPAIEVVQIQFNYVDYDDPSVQSRKCYEVCRKFNKPVIVMEPVKGGNLVKLPDDARAVLDALHGGSPASYAIRFAAGFPGMLMVLSGMSTPEQVQDNISFMKDFKPLDETELAAIAKVQEIFRSKNLIPCTGCRYCTDGCPKQIAIPELFATMNAKQIHHDWHTDYYYNAVYALPGHKASDCVKCGKCESVCPQHLPIRQLLENVAKEFEKKEA